jgi:hypothetical protein
MITLKMEGTEIGIEESAIKDMVMAGLPGWLEEMASKDAKSKTIFLGVKGLAIVMLSDIRRKAAKAGIQMPDPPEDENPVITLANLLLNYSMEFIEGQSARAIYRIDGNRIVIIGIEVGGSVFEVPAQKEVAQ